MKQMLCAWVLGMVVVFGNAHSTAQDSIVGADSMAGRISLSSAQSPAGKLERPFSLRVVTWNVWGVPYVTPQRKERMKHIAEAFAFIDADLVALQEVWTDEDEATLEAGLRSAGYIFVERTSGDGQESGLMMASRFPVSKLKFVPFDLGSTGHVLWHVDWKADKGVTIATVNTPFGPVEFANTHLQSRYGDPAGYASVRLGQSAQIGVALGASQNHALLLAGDFNSPTDDLPARWLRAANGLREGAPQFGIDNILYRGSTHTRWARAGARRMFDRPRTVGTQERTLSDHDAVVVNFSIGTPSEFVGEQVIGVLAEARLAAITGLASRKLETAIARVGFALCFTLLLLFFRRRYLFGVLRKGAFVGLSLGFVWLANFAFLHGPASVVGHQALVSFLQTRTPFENDDSAARGPSFAQVGTHVTAVTSALPPDMNQPETDVSD